MKFILTKELGRLTRWLRLLGFDAEYFESSDMKKLFLAAFNEARAVITKRRDISSTKNFKVIYVKSDTLKGQFSELRRKLGKDLDKSGLFTRCADCNKEVFRVNKSSVAGLVPPYVFKTQKNFFQCPKCGKFFWKATHWDRAREFLHRLR